MAIRYFALVYGIVFLLVGIAGFIPAFVAPYDASHPQLSVDSGAGLLFGLFPVNVLHNLTHALFGLWGLLAWRSLGSARAYARAVAVIYGLFVLLGLIPGLMTVFGLVPLHGHDIWLHLLLAGVAAYFGYVHAPGHAARATGSGTPPRAGPVDGGLARPGATPASAPGGVASGAPSAAPVVTGSPTAPDVSTATPAGPGSAPGTAPGASTASPADSTSTSAPGSAQGRPPGGAPGTGAESHRTRRM